MNAKEHYDNHLAEVYSWMAGDFNTIQQKQEALFRKMGISPNAGGVAIDLGAGHGVQSVSLAKLGFTVRAIDFNQQLLSELEINSKGLPITPFYDTLQNIKQYVAPAPELIVCCGDTLTHLDTLQEVDLLFKDCAEVLTENGKIVLSFRDYSTEQTGATKFIPVKSDDTRILTCCLSYEADRVKVYDLVHYRTENGWQQNCSGYYKLRLAPGYVFDLLKKEGFTTVDTKTENGMLYAIGKKG